MSAPADRRDASPLGVYMKTCGISTELFAKAINLSPRGVDLLATGRSLPTLPVAYEIERITKGVVPLESWFGLPQAKEILQRMRAGQPEAIQKWKGTVELPPVKPKTKKKARK